MGIARGPNIVTDGLVFGYDTGYGVADNTTATRFYPGEKTTNNTIQTGYSWNGDGSNQSFANKGATTITDNSLKYNGYDTVLWTPGTSLNCYINGSSDLNLNDNSTIWTFSCYVRRDDGAAITSLSVYMYYPNGDGSASGTIVDCGDGWYRVSRTRTGNNDNISLAGFTGFTSGHKYYLSGVMLTKNNHTVPYVNVQTSRSSTQSLIDLKRTTDIDVSNVSFDSTGQPTFDGTDDEINTGITTQLTDFSCVVIFKDDGSASWGRLVDKQYTTGFFISSYFASVGNNYVGAGVVEPSSPHGQALQYDDTKYNYFVLTRSGSTHTIYLNGSTNKLQKTNGSSATLSSTEMAIGAWNGSNASQRYTGEIPVVKLYNKELTAAEIQQDFNAYKNRFNI
mgnify:CR=1 FL=1